MYYIAESLADYNNEMLSEGILDTLKMNIPVIDKKNILKYAILTYMAGVGIKEYNDVKTNKIVDDAINNNYRVTILDIKSIARFLAGDKSINKKSTDIEANNLKTKIETVNNNTKSAAVKSNVNNVKFYNMMFDLSKPIRLSKGAQDRLKKTESLRLDCYHAKVNLKDGRVGQESFLTVGYGHKLPKNTKYKKGQKITKTQADKLFAEDLDIKVGEDLRKILRTMKKNNIDINKIPQNVIDVMGDLLFNTGYTNFIKTKFYKYMITGKFASAIKVLPKTCITSSDSKAVQPGLMNRRNEQTELLKSGYDYKLNMWVKK